MVAQVHRWRVLAALVPAALALSCFEQPITESMEVRFLAPAAAMVRVTVRLADPERFKDSQAARDRIEAARRAIAERRDPWSDRLARMEPEEERITWDRTAGDVIRFDHRALVADTDRLPAFFRDTLVQAAVRRREGSMEFILTPWPGSRAGRQDEERFTRAMEKWADVVVRHCETGRRLFDYLEDNPDRARPCFASLFKDLLPEDARDDAEPLTDRDAHVVDPFSVAMSDLLSLFALSSGEAYSLDELSALVHDPFPAPLTVRVPGPILEVEGFETGEGGLVRVPPVSLWAAFRRLDARWISPDPAVVYYEHLRERDLDLDAFLARRRAASPPAGPAEVLAALTEEMRAAPLYRVSWSTVDLEPPEVRGEIWDLPALQ